MERTVFYISDGTALTAKGLGKSLLSQFGHISFKEKIRPFIDTKEKVLSLIKEMDREALLSKKPFIAFASMMDDSLMSLLLIKYPEVIDIFSPFIKKLEGLIDQKSSKEVGLAHNISKEPMYEHRIQAIDFALATDDGLRMSEYERADLIILGISRSGKTPTSVYLALQFGLKVANYPFTSDDLPEFALNDALLKNRSKLFGLVISKERLLFIRNERRPGSPYADKDLIDQEIVALERLFFEENIPFIDATNRSVEEIASSIFYSMRVQRET